MLLDIASDTVQFNADQTWFVNLMAQNFALFELKTTVESYLLSFGYL